ncbi:MAG: CAP domain-containing protein [Candidatus Buchananbacteria bacterium]|nr:CAP domain-containing protein [Candidatus Buchananbacteria bacterium]
MFKKQDGGKTKKYLTLIGALSVVINAFGVFFVLFRPKRWRQFIKGQKKEFSELSSGKEDFVRFTKDSSRLLKDLFIPDVSNDHRPIVLRPKNLLSLAVTAVAIKLIVTGFLFLTYPSPAQLSAIISSNIISLINQSRTDAGVEALAENEYLTKYAYEKGQDMITNDYFAHDTPDGKRPWQWINRGDYDYVYAGENLAMDFTNAEVVHDAFMKSPSHRRNILNPKYKDVGIAVINGELNGHQTILLVQFFGTKRSDAATSVAQANEIPSQPPNADQVPVAEVVETETNPDVLAAGTANEGLIVVTTQQQATKPLVNMIVEYSNIFFIAFLIFMFLSLMLNIFIKIRVQHASVILQSLAVIALLVSLILVKFHFIEQVAPQILIL